MYLGAGIRTLDVALRQCPSRRFSSLLSPQRQSASFSPSYTLRTGVERRVRCAQLALPISLSASNNNDFGFGTHSAPGQKTGRLEPCALLTRFIRSLDRSFRPRKTFFLLRQAASLRRSEALCWQREMYRQILREIFTKSLFNLR